MEWTSRPVMCMEHWLPCIIVIPFCHRRRSRSLASPQLLLCAQPAVLRTPTPSSAESGWPGPPWGGVLKALMI